MILGKGHLRGHSKDAASSGQGRIICVTFADKVSDILSTFMFALNNSMVTHECMKTVKLRLENVLETYFVFSESLKSVTVVGFFTHT